MKFGVRKCGWVCFMGNDIYGYIWTYMDIYGHNMGIYMETNACRRVKMDTDLICDGYYNNYGKCEINARFRETENGLFDL